MLQYDNPSKHAQWNRQNNTDTQVDEQLSKTGEEVTGLGVRGFFLD